jgi:hypothetical protein
MKGRHIRRIDELARDVPPARDLWPAISEAIEADRVAVGVPERKQAGRRSFWMPAAGLAASVVLVAVGVFIGQWIGPQKGIPDGQSTVARNPAPQNRAPALDPSDMRHAKYTNQREELLREVNLKLQTMPPADRAKVAASLETLQKSIKEIEAALGRDPANALLQELLVSSCQEEMRALTAVRDSGREEI